MPRLQRVPTPCPKCQWFYTDGEYDWFGHENRNHCRVRIHITMGEEIYYIKNTSTEVWAQYYGMHPEHKGDGLDDEVEDN